MNSRLWLVKRVPGFTILRWSAANTLGLIFLSSALGGDLRIVQRTINSYANGERIYTCLALDGGVVPLVPPAGATLEVEKAGLKLRWPDDATSAVFRPASAEEALLLDGMDGPGARPAWEKYLTAKMSYLECEFSPRDFQPGILAVNHWRIGAVSLDYQLGGVRYSCLLLLWRAQDGSTLAVTMNSEFEKFTTRRDQIYGMIGSATLIPNQDEHGENPVPIGDALETKEPAPQSL